MKYRRHTRLLAPMFLVVATLAGVPAGAQQREAAVAAIAEVRDTFVADYAAGNVDAIVATYHPEATFAGTLQPFWLEGEEAIRDLWSRYFAAWPRRQLKFRQPVVRLYGDSTSVETGYMEMYMGNADQTVATYIRYSITRVLEKDRWLIVNMNVARLPGN